MKARLSIFLISTLALSVYQLQGLEYVWGVGGGMFKTLELCFEEDI